MATRVLRGVRWAAEKARHRQGAGRGIKDHPAVVPGQRWPGRNKWMSGVRAGSVRDDCRSILTEARERSLASAANSNSRDDSASPATRLFMLIAVRDLPPLAIPMDWSGD